MARRNRGITDQQICDRLNELDGEDSDDDLHDIEIEPEPDSDDGIEVEQTVVYENRVNIFLFIWYFLLQIHVPILFISD